MQIQKVRIKNFRGIEEREIEFKPGFNLIKGENGKGKTSILEAIAVGLGGYIAGMKDVAVRNLSLSDIRCVYPLQGDGSIDEKRIVPVEVELEVTIGEDHFQWKRSRGALARKIESIQPTDICKKAEEMSMDEDCDLPVIFYESAARVWSQKNDRTKNIFRKSYYRTVGYTDALSGAPSTGLLLNWCVKMELISWQKQKKIAEYEAAKKAVSDFMQKMNQSGEYRVFYDSQTENLMYQTGEKAEPFGNLSAGYQSLVWMILEIAYRMAVLNPNKREKITETPGIVLIDEIDVHLHPKWQWNIIEALRGVFPNVQFIAATHAPILFASAKNVWIVDVEEKEIQYSWSHYGLDVNNTLRKYQGTENVKSAVQKKVDEFYELIDKEEYDLAENLLNGLEEETKPTHPLIIEMRTTLDLERMNLEDDDEAQDLEEEILSDDSEEDDEKELFQAARLERI